MENQIKKTVLKIEKAASKRDVEQLNELLHEEYRVVANRFRGAKTATIINKDVYLAMMVDKKIGGTTYEVQFNDIKITGHTAMIDLTYTSKTTADMHKYLILIQDEDDQWKAVSDVPLVIDK